MPVHKPGQVNIKKMLKPHYVTMIEIAQRKTFALPENIISLDEDGQLACQ
jgi:hypothetical protein